METDGPRLAGFEPTPEATPSSNGSHVTRRRSISPGGITLGVLAGSVTAVSLVGTIQWLNLGTVGWWGRPVIAAAVAGVLVAAWRRDDPRSAAIGGAIAALLSLWGVYAIARLSTRVIFIERSIAGVVISDLVLLAAYAVPAGAIGALVPIGVYRIVVRFGRERPTSST